MTLIIKSNAITSPNSMAAIDLAQARIDASIVAIPGLRAWWRPDFGLTGTGAGTEGTGAGVVWLDMINQYRLIAMSDTGPQSIASAFNSRPCLRFNAAGRNGRMYDPDSRALWPASGSVTIVYVAKDAGGSNTAYLGTDRSTGYAQIAHASSGAVRVQHQNPTNLFTGTVPGDTDPHIGLWSYDFSDHSYAFRINQASVQTGTAGAEVLAGNLTVGTAGNTGSPTFRGDFYELLVFSAPLHITDNAAYLATVESTLMAHYGL